MNLWLSGAAVVLGLLVAGLHFWPLGLAVLILLAVLWRSS